MEANNDLYVLQIAILVGGSEHEMDYDFPIDWEFHHPN